MVKHNPTVEIPANQLDGHQPADCSASTPCNDKLDTSQYSLGNAQSASLDLGSKSYPFLEPAQGPDELGWLAHYRIVKLLGEGGMGLVFLAEDPRLKRRLAIKVMRPEMAQNNVIRQRFLREARATAAVRSDHIVSIFDIGQCKDIPYVATDLLHGISLDDHLKNGAPLPGAEVVRIGLQLAKGLQAAHSAGLIHRDIKPSNIWVEEGTRRIKILDFGLSRFADAGETFTQCGTVIGTPTYMAPEQVNGDRVDYRCDLFSLGCVLYEAAAGKKPFDGKSMMSALKATATVDPPHLHEVAPGLPVDLCDLVMQMLAKNPEDRPASAAEVADHLEALAETVLSPSATRKIAKLSSPRRTALVRRRRFKSVIIIAGAAIAIAAGFELITYLVKPGSFRPEQTTTSASSKSDSVAPGVQGVTNDEIVFGISAPFSGPSRELGRELKLGIETCFHQVNDQGGIAGRKLRLVALDDGYKPDRALANMKRLDESDHVFAFIGNVGTPTAEQTLPYALSKKMLFLGAFTGAPLLRADPPDRYVFNYRASYTEETAAIVRYLMEIKRLSAEEIAVFAQEDGYGDAGFNGVAKVLRQHGRQPEQILRVGYARNSSQVGEAVQEILSHKEVRAVVMVATYHAAAEFIRQCKDAKRELTFANVSFVGTDALGEELRQKGPSYAKGVIVSQVVPHAASHSSAVLKFRELLSQYSPSEEAGFVSLEGYIDATILVEGLRRAGTNLTTESLVEALESIHGLDIGLGAPLSFSPSEHQASHKVWGTAFDDQGKLQIVQLE